MAVPKQWYDFIIKRNTKLSRQDVIRVYNVISNYPVRVCKFQKNRIEVIHVDGNIVHDCRIKNTQVVYAVELKEKGECVYEVYPPVVLLNKDSKTVLVILGDDPLRIGELVKYLRKYINTEEYALFVPYLGKSGNIVEFAVKIYGYPFSKNNKYAITHKCGERKYTIKSEMGTLEVIGECSTTIVKARIWTSKFDPEKTIIWILSEIENVKRKIRGVQLVTKRR